MTKTYSTYRNAMKNAAAIGNARAALSFAEKAAACKWVEPMDWRPHVCFARGIPLRGMDFANTKTFTTKARAQDAARSIGWPVGEVAKVYSPLHGEMWALVDGRFGLLSRAGFANPAAT